MASAVSIFEDIFVGIEKDDKLILCRSLFQESTEVAGFALEVEKVQANFTKNGLCLTDHSLSSRY